VESSAFKSGTKRFQQKETGVPAAGNYTVYSEIVRNKSFRIYREKAPFESGAARFDAKKFQEIVTTDLIWANNLYRKCTKICNDLFFLADFFSHISNVVQFRNY